MQEDCMLRDFSPEVSSEARLFRFDVETLGSISISKALRSKGLPIYHRQSRLIEKGIKDRQSRRPLLYQRLPEQSDQFDDRSNLHLQPTCTSPTWTRMVAASRAASASAPAPKCTNAPVASTCFGAKTTYLAAVVALRKDGWAPENYGTEETRSSCRTPAKVGHCDASLLIFSTVGIWRVHVSVYVPSI